MEEMEKDPGLIIHYGPDQVIHDALAQPNSPVPQGNTASASAAALKQYIYDVVLTTLVSESDNGVLRNDSENFVQYFHRLPQDTFFKIKGRLLTELVTGNTPASRWSLAVSAPPQHPLGCLIKVTGGVGLGQVCMEVVAIRQGIFKTFA